METKTVEPPKPIELRAFLEGGALYEDTQVLARVYHRTKPPKGETFTLHLPVIRLHCSSRQCQGPRSFQPGYGTESRFWELEKMIPYASEGDTAVLHGRALIDYMCKNCELEKKTYVLEINVNFERSLPDDDHGTPLRPVSIMKLGEYPHRSHTHRETFLECLESKRICI